MTLSGKVFAGWLAAILGTVYVAVLLLSHDYYPDASSGVSRILEVRSPLPTDEDFPLSFDDSVVSGNISRRQDDFSCGPGRPCSNSACCGKDGFCGYGPTYCGDGCTSNCNAHAECGKDSDPPGKTCPLNVCCSEFGFCGTTEEFCGVKCQSNCVLEPSPPSGSAQGQVLSRVVGYYESWNYRSSCRETKPSDLPLDALTHVNYAFAFLDAATYHITPMDSGTTADLFTETTNLKQLKPGLEVWLSLGGWTFSDNGTSTQPLLSDIARDSSKRTVWANHVVSFLNTYGFDGIDIDWEYPGAPDRGGKPEDVQNFVELMASLRNAFNSAGRKLGISFTIPASYWYLRWFDVPGLLRYADFTNMMSYDIHGTWDKQNAIGNVLHPHTNLTEIKKAAELLWRNNVPPNKVSLGFGFYGRSYTLSDPSCSTPGTCLFSDGGAPGPCTATSGYLSYYEIQDVLAKNPGITVNWDQEASVKYFKWNSDQWIAYDDKDTFKQKVDWANSVGFSGSLIWASDLDDNQLSAHAALLGRSVKTNNDVRSTTLAELNTVNLLNANLDQQCRIIRYCTSVEGPYASVNFCNTGESYFGFDRAGCGKFKASKIIELHQGHPICCKTTMAPRECTWRGNPSECNGRCHDGEATLWQSSWGGWPSESGDKRCGRGSKAFCCTMPDTVPALLKQCRWTGCGKGCNSDEQDMGKVATDGDDWCGVARGGKHFCCRASNPAFKQCTWRGHGDCVDNTCKGNEVTVRTAADGDDAWHACRWGRQKSFCCEPNNQMTPIMCDKNTICSASLWAFQNLCQPDPWADDSPNSKRELGDDTYATPFEADRIVDGSESTGLVPVSRELHQPTPFWEVISKRAPSRRTVNSYIHVFLGAHLVETVIRLLAQSYPGPATLTATQNGAQNASPLAFRPAGGQCSTTGIESFPRALLAVNGPGSINTQGRGYDTDHPIELQYIGQLLTALVDGLLPSGTNINQILPNVQTIPWTTMRPYWDEDMPYNQAIGALPDPTPFTDVNWGNINSRLFEILGSKTNRVPFRTLDRPMNNMKGKIFARQNPYDLTELRNHINNAIANGQGEEAFLQPMRMVVAIFRYLFDPNVSNSIQTQRNQLLAQATAITNNIPALQPFLAIWTEFDRDFFEATANFARTWVADQIITVIAAYQAAIQANPNNPPANAAQVLNELNALFDSLHYIRAPP